MNDQAILFDYDYTLGDSTEPIVSSFTAALGEMGWPAPERQAVRLTIGHTLQDAYTMVTGDSQEQQREEFYRRFRAHSVPIMARDTRLLPGAAELLTWLAGRNIPCGVVSTKSRDVLEQIFLRQGLREKLALIVGAQDVRRAKPDPEGLLLALEQLGLGPERVLYCGDTALDAQAAQAAHLPFCAVLNGTTPAAAFEAFPHVCVAPDLPGLRDWLEHTAVLGKH
ncbi:MAG: HAD family hydrolase [Oscillospiraceae bacterium]|nr:HAD family hydrolase [Oscillospiraceae bacterium]